MVPEDLPVAEFAFPGPLRDPGFTVDEDTMLVVEEFRLV